MSLLLDALQRASQEKEKLAEERAAADKAARDGEPATPVSFPPLAIDFEPGAVDVTPAVSLEESAPVPTPVESMASASAPVAVAPPSNPSGDTAPRATPAAELTLNPMESLASPTVFAPDVAPAADVAPVADVALAPRVEHTQQAARERIEPSAAPRVPVTETVPTRPSAAVHPSPTVSPQVAREILGATAKPAQSRPGRRLIVLGVVVLLVAVANAAFFMGFLDGFLGVSGSSLVPSLPPPPLAEPPPAQQTVAAASGQGDDPTAAAPDARAPEGEPAASHGTAPRDKESKPDAPPLRRATASAPAARASAQTSTQTSDANPAGPVFVAKPAAASILDTAYAALSEGRLDEAAVSYNTALAENPGERDALLGLAYIAQHQGRRDDARAYYQRVLRQEPGHPGASAGLLTIAAEGNLQLTASRAREMAERNPDSAVAMATLGGILAREGRIAEAQQAYFRALTLEPENALHAYNLAVALDRLHKYLPAWGYYQKALALAEKSGSGARADFPWAAAQQRLEQLRKPETNAQTTLPPESGSR